MRSVSKLLALTAPLLASAAPLSKRAPSATDVLVVQFAHVLEAFESTMYTKAIEKFKAQDFLDAGYTSAEVAVEQLQQILRDELIHDSALTQALKDFAVEPLQCQFNIDSVLTDVPTTMAAARLVEVTGVAAYLGAGALLSDKRLLLAANTIGGAESRHHTDLNILNGGASVPQAFEIPLAPEQVLAIAGGFISGCDLGVKANPALTITANGPIGPNTQLTFASPGIDAAAGQELFCHMIVGGAVTSVALPINQCVVPPGIQGPVAVYITNDRDPILATNILDQNKTPIVAGPNFVFVDFGVPMQTIARLVLKPDSPLAKDLTGAPPSVDVSTNTISPDEASSKINSAEQTNAATADGAAPTGAPAVTSAIFLGDVIPKMPGAGEEPPAPTPAVGPLPALGSDGLPLAPSSTDGVVDSAGLPLPTPPPAGGAAAAGDILPVVPGSEGPAAGDIVPSIAGSD